LGNVTVKRFNPTYGSTVTVGTYAASSSQSFNTGGLSDAVLLFDAVSSTTPPPAPTQAP